MIAFRSDAEVARAIPDAVLHLVRHGLLAYPTETVYGLGCVAAAEPVQRLARIKGRDATKPFLLIVSDLAMLEAVGLRLTDAAHRFAAAFWPGPLTLVLPGGEGVLPDALRGPEGGIAVRWTSHDATQRLVRTVGSPITSTSANRPGAPPAMDAASVAESFAAAERGGELLVLDGGHLVPSPPSTLVDCTGLSPRIVRPGAVGLEWLRAIVPAVTA